LNIFKFDISLNFPKQVDHTPQINFSNVKGIFLAVSKNKKDWQGLAVYRPFHVGSWPVHRQMQSRAMPSQIARKLSITRV